ncbi:MAG: type IV pilus assembly [Gallionellaceae bacterium]|nr:MAG: type IV pilus assembly [Gallionellaceae bacterium]
MTQSVDNSDFAIHNPKEIVFILDDLVKQRAGINLHTSDGLNVLTTVLEVNAEDDYVLLDISQDAAMNKQVVNSKNLTFSTQSGVRVRWRSTQVQMVSLADGDAFSIDVPETIERIQRREYFRLSVPQGSRGLICKFPDGEAVYEVSIVDMSVGGIGVSIKGTPHAMFSQGALLEGCSIEFPVVGPVPINLKVCGIRSTGTTRSGEQMYHVGMEFVKLSRGAGNVVQRYMIQLESERLSVS